MKVKLEFQLPEEMEEYESAMNGSRYKYQLDEVWERLLRQPFKHGYRDQELQELYESLGDKGYEFVDKLRDLYQEIVQGE